MIPESCNIQSVYQVVELSTHHLTVSDVEVLTDLSSMIDPMVFERETGFFLKLYSDDVRRNYRDGYSQALRSVVDWAFQSNYRMIEFDSAVAPLTRFPVYQW